MFISVSVFTLFEPIEGLVLILYAIIKLAKKTSSQSKLVIKLEQGFYSSKKNFKVKHNLTFCQSTFNSLPVERVFSHASFQIKKFLFKYFFRKIINNRFLIIGKRSKGHVNG